MIQAVIVIQQPWVIVEDERFHSCDILSRLTLLMSYLCEV